MADHLYRSRDDRMLAGVAGGLAERWDTDPSLVRLVWALLVILTGGIALIVYIVMAIVVPEGDGDLRQPATVPGWPAGPAPAAATGPAPAATPDSIAATPAPTAATPASYWVPTNVDTRADARAARRAARRQRGDSVAPAVIGVFLVLLGGFFLARQWLPELDWDWFWPVMFIVVGVVLFARGMDHRPGDSGGQA